MLSSYRFPLQSGLCVRAGACLAAIAGGQCSVFSLREGELIKEKVAEIVCDVAATSSDGKFLVVGSGCKVLKYDMTSWSVMHTFELDKPVHHIQCSANYVFCAPRHGQHYTILSLAELTLACKPCNLGCYPVCDTCTFSDEWLIVGGHDDGSSFHRFRFDGKSLTHMPFYLGGMHGALIVGSEMYLNFYCTQVHVYPVYAARMRDIEPTRKYFNGPHPWTTSTLAAHGQSLLMLGQGGLCIWGIHDCTLRVAIKLETRFPNVIVSSGGLVAVCKDIGTCHFKCWEDNVEMFDVSLALR